VTALRPAPWQWFCIALVYYSLATTGGRFDLIAPVERGLTFNSMLDHLVDGRFDVDPQVIQTEGFVRDGRTYAYFGVFPALLRAPLLAGGLIDTIDVTVLFCVIAAALAAYFKVSVVATIQRAFPATKANVVLFGAVVMAIVFGGPQVQFLRPSIYQEPVLWAAAIAAGYVCLVIRSLVAERVFPGSRITWLSVLAGTAVITRVSIGLGLYLSTAFLLLVLTYQQTRGLTEGRAIAFLKTLFGSWRRAWAILLFFSVAAGVVNYGRFGNPLTFADLRLNREMQMRPERLQRLIEHGELNPKRIGYALLYYFIPINLARTSNGRLLFQDFQVRMVDPPELPPSSFFLSDPLWMLLAGVSVWSVLRSRRWGDVNTSQAVAALAGLTVPPAIVCMAIYLAFRYRLDFYPLFDLLAFLGLYTFLLTRMHSHGTSQRRLGKVLEYSALLQIAASHLLLMFYKVTPFGDPTAAITRDGVLNLYLRVFALPF
jgi:hypothetical protein